MSDEQKTGFDEIVNDHPQDPDINPPEPVDKGGDVVEYPTDPNFVPSEDDKDLTPVEADEDYSPSDADDPEEG